MNALHSLGQLIQSVEDSRGWTMREIARRAERAQVPLSNAYLGKLKRQRIRSITIETIHALAVGLDLPERVVAIAAIEAMGVHDLQPNEAGAAQSIARDPDLSDRDRRVLLAALREMQSEPAAPDLAHDPTPAHRRPVEDPPLADGVTYDPADRPDVDPHERPWEDDPYALAALHGRNRGKEMRQRQDADAERPDDLPSDDPA